MTTFFFGVDIISSAVDRTLKRVFHINTNNLLEDFCVSFYLEGPNNIMPSKDIKLQLSALTNWATPPLGYIPQLVPFQFIFLCKWQISERFRLLLKK